MKNKIIISSLIFLIISCYKSEKKETNLKNNLNKTEQEKTNASILEKEIDTTVVIYYSTGEPRYVQNYNIWGDLTGEWINYYKDGKIKQKGIYKYCCRYCKL